MIQVLGCTRRFKEKTEEYWTLKKTHFDLAEFSTDPWDFKRDLEEDELFERLDSKWANMDALRQELDKIKEAIKDERGEAMYAQMVPLAFRPKERRQ